MSMILQNPQQMQALMQHLTPMLQQQQPNTMHPPANNPAPATPGTTPAINPVGTPNTMYRPYGSPGVTPAPPAAGYPNIMHPLASGSLA